MRRILIWLTLATPLATLGQTPATTSNHKSVPENVINISEGVYQAKTMTVLYAAYSGRKGVTTLYMAPDMLRSVFDLPERPAAQDTSRLHIILEPPSRGGTVSYAVRKTDPKADQGKELGYFTHDPCLRLISARVSDDFTAADMEALRRSADKMVSGEMSTLLLRFPSGDQIISLYKRQNPVFGASKIKIVPWGAPPPKDYEMIFDGNAQTNSVYGKDIKTKYMGTNLTMIITSVDNRELILIDVDNSDDASEAAYLLLMSRLGQHPAK